MLLLSTQKIGSGAGRTSAIEEDGACKSDNVCEVNGWAKSSVNTADTNGADDNDDDDVPSD